MKNFYSFKFKFLENFLCFQGMSDRFGEVRKEMIYIHQQSGRSDEQKHTPDQLHPQGGEFENSFYHLADSNAEVAQKACH